MTRRIPYWLSPYELDVLSRIIAKDTDNEHKLLLEGIRNEIGVARIRAESTRIDTAALIIVLGFIKGSLPIHLSDEEAAFLKLMNTLPQSVKDKLS